MMWASTGLNVAGRTKKSIVSAVIFIGFCAGFCIGPQIFFAKSAPAYRPGLIFCCSVFCTIEATIVAWLIWVRWENRRRDNRAAASSVSREQAELEGCLFGLNDMTDIEVGGKDQLATVPH